MDQTLVTSASAGQSEVARQVTAEENAGVATRAQAGVGPIPRLPPGFLPRPELLAQLNQARWPSVVQVVTGVPGAGKTQLAAAYARARLAEGWRLVAWIHAGNTASLLAGLAAVADAAGLSGGGSAPDEAEVGQAVRQLLEASGDRCLLVFDDVEDPDLVRPLVPSRGAAQVLITTAGPSAGNLGPSLAVGVFSAEEAVAFLDGRTGLGDAGAAPVVAELGSLPLALAQAAAVIAGQELDYASYLERLNALTPGEHRSPEQEQPYPRRAAGSVALALDAVQASDQAGVSSRVLGVTAVLSAAGVRRELLYAAGREGALAGDELPVAAEAVDRALDRLVGQSLLDVSLDGQTVVIHRLVAGVVCAALARQGRLASTCRAAAAALEARADELAGSVGDIPEQVAALADNTARLAEAADQELADAVLRLRFLALSRLVERGDSARSVALGKQLTAELDRALGRDHPSTISARDSLAAAYLSAGMSIVAIPMFHRVLIDRERVLGPDHPDTMRSRQNLADALRKTGQAAQAIPLVAQILATRERLLGADHPRTLRARNNLGAAYLEAGRAAEAVFLFEQTLAACERLLGADDPRTQATRHNLALARQEAGQGQQGAG